MTKEQKDNLFVLVKSLSKSEKRQFKLYVGRLGVNEDSKFLMLFNILDKLSVYDEAFILKKGIVKKQQLSNLKAHLYKQILISLRLNPSHKDIRLQIREQLDFATILYHKGLYKQSLKLLDKAKSLAILNEEKNVAYEVVELEKVIESQYITRSLSNRADELTIQAKELSLHNVLASKLSNLSLQLYGLYLKIGYIKNDEDYKQVTKYFNDRLPKYDIHELGFREKLWLYKSYLWYSFLTVDFLSCYKYSLKWVDLFYAKEEMIELNPVFFLSGNNYLLESLYFLRKYDKFKESLIKFEGVTKEKWFPKDDNLDGLAFLYIYNNKFNLHFIEGSFDEGLPLVDTQFLDKIISNKSLQMREDLLCFSRILNLVAHYEAGLDYNLDVLIKSTYKFLIKMEDLYEVQKEFIKFLRGLGDIYPHEVKNEFKKLHKKLKEYENDPYQSRAFLYLDIISWLESKIQNRPIGLVIRNKFHELKVK